MLILKQNAANTVPTPPAGKGTIFLDDSDTLSVKTSDGNVETFPTVAASNSQVVFMNGTALSGEAALTYNFNTNVLNVTGNVAAGNVLTDNLLYANGTAWDLSDPGGSNTQIQFNDDESFGGSAALTFNKSSNAVTMSGNLSAGNVSATLLTGTLTTAAQPNVTSVGTLSGLAVTANITAGNVYANSGVIGASVLAGSLSTAAQPNITSVGSLTSLTVTGNANVSNIGGNNGVFTTVSGTLSTAAQPNITSVGTLSALGVNGNLTAANINANTGAFYGNAAGLTNIPGGNITGNITGNISNANFAAFAAEVTDASQPNITSVGTLVDLTVTGNASAGNFNTAGKVVASTLESNVTTGTAPFVVTSTTKVTNLNADLLDGYSTATTATGNTVVIRDTDGSFSANIITATLSGAATTAGTVTTAAQPNITSVGTLTSLGVNGTVTAVAFTANTGVFTGNGSGLSAIAGANVTGTVSSATTAGTVTTAAQPNITSVGTLSSLAVTGNASAGNVNAGNLLTANFVAGTLTTAAQPNVTSVGTLTGLSVDGSNITLANGVYVGNGSGLSALAGGNVTGQVGNALVAGTVYTNAQPNITSVGTLSSLAVTGNATAGNVYANSGTIGASLLTGTLTTAAQPNITSVGTLSSLAVTGNVAAGNLTTTGVLSVTGTGVSSIAGNLDMTSNTIINLASPTNPNDAATKQYVDDVAQGLHTHDSCNAATDSTLATISGGTVTYNNGTAGVGATLTTTGSYTTIDGVTLSNGMRILVKNEANAAHNGIYDRTSTTVLTRSSDFDTPTEMAGGDFTFVNAGTLYDNTGWVMPDPVTTVGTTAVNWVQFSGAGTYTAGTGLTLTGSVFSVNASQTQVTALGTVTSGTWNSIVGSSATFAAGLSGANLASLNASNISSGTLDQARLANASLTVNGQSISLGGSGTITANTTQTLTLGGFLTGTSFNGGTAVTAAVDATSANTASKVVARDASGNFSAGTITATLSGAATTAGTVTTAAQPNITSVGTLSSLSVTGNISAGNVSVSAGTVTLGTLTTGANTTAGTITGNFSLSAGSRLNATYADLAEKYVADADYEAGTVLVFGGVHEVTLSTDHDSHRVAGVVSTNPAYTMNNDCAGAHVATIALQGRVPVKVHGPVAKGDLMVSGPDGRAVANNMARAGTILGKALENFEGGSGVIEVAVGRF